jgi:hypothetical protein
LVLPVYFDPGALEEIKNSFSSIFTIFVTHVTGNLAINHLGPIQKSTTLSV